MVNFKNDSTVSTPAVDINKIQILERRSYVIDALEQYLSLRHRGAQGMEYIFRSRLASLFWEIEETLYRQYDTMILAMEESKNNKLQKEKKLKYNEIKKIVLGKGEEQKPINETIEAWECINRFLGEIRLTRFDTKPQYDNTDTELENDEHGL